MDREEFQERFGDADWEDDGKVIRVPLQHEALLAEYNVYGIRDGHDLVLRMVEHISGFLWLVSEDDSD